MKTLLTLLLVLASPFLVAASCDSTRPNVPELVRVAIETPKPLPDELVRPLVKPERQTGTIEALKISHDQRGDVIDTANCHRALVDRLAKGEKVDAKACTDER